MMSERYRRGVKLLAASVVSSFLAALMFVGMHMTELATNIAIMFVVGCCLMTMGMVFALAFIKMESRHGD